MAKHRPLIQRGNRYRQDSIKVMPAGLELVERLAAEGNDKRTIATCLGISIAVWPRLCERQPEFDEALERGRRHLPH